MEWREWRVAHVIDLLVNMTVSKENWISIKNLHLLQEDI